MTEPTHPTARFGDVVRNVKENERNPLENGLERYIGLEHLDPESLHIKRWGLIAEGTSFTRKFTKGQVLFGKRRAYQRKAALAEFDGICSGDILVFEPKSDRLLPELLPFIVQSDPFFDHALRTSAGSLSPRTKWRDLANYEFPLPPLDEQRRIAEILWAADEVVQKDKKLVGELITFRSILFRHLLKIMPTHDLPKVKLADLLTSSPESGHSPVSAGKDTGHYVLILSSLTPNGYESGHLKPVDLTPSVKATRLKTGDFLISRSNTTELVGLVGIFDERRNDISFPDTMMRLPVNEGKIKKRFLEQVLLSLIGRRQIRRIAAGTSGSMKKINRKGIASLDIPLPTMNAQESIINKLDACTQTLQVVESRLANSEKLKLSLLDRLLTRCCISIFNEANTAENDTSPK